MSSKGEKTILLPVLIDTLVWQKYFHKDERTFREVNALMDAGRICCIDFVVAELLQTAETEEEIKVIQDFTRIFPILKESMGTWVEAARLAFKLRGQGKKMLLRDCYLAVMAQAHGVLLYTTSKALHQNRRSLSLDLEFFPERRTSA